jgi:hypothetical protein
MSTETCNPLLGTLAELSRLYPEMRFGQLIEMVALLSSEETPISVAEVDDDRFVSTASHHLRVRGQQLKIENGSLQGRPLPASRTELLDLLQRVCERHRDWRFGPLVEHLAASSGSSLYDAEDEQLLAAARSDPVS